MRAASTGVITTGVAKHLSAAALMLIGTALTTSPALAQAGVAVLGAEQASSDLLERLDANTKGEGDALCVVFSMEELAAKEGLAVPRNSLSDDLITVSASCQGQGFTLGTAESFEVATYSKSGAVAVLMTRFSRPRLFLLSQGEAGSILREDMTGELSRAAGRGGMSGLADIVVDLSAFEQTGRILLTPSARPDAKPSHAATLALAERLEARAANDASQEAGL